MKTCILLLAAILAVGARAADKMTSRDLVGKWEGGVNFGKTKLTLILRVTTNDAGGIKATLDLPDQGQTGLPINALLFNAPDMRLEVDAFNTAYNGEVNENLTEITGAFEEGPGGRPEPVTFKRSTEADAPEPVKSYTFAAGEAPDIRGYWRGEVEAGPMGKLLAGLNIGRLPDGAFKATLDLPEQGAKDIPASTVSYTNGEAVLEWKIFQSTLRAKLSEDGKKLAGHWIQGGRTNPLTYTRLDARFQLLATDLVYTADAGRSDDVRGTWKGTLETPGGKLRLVFRVGRSPDGSFGGTLASPDQGGREIPASNAEYSGSNLKMEFPGIRGKYDGKLSNDGKILEGKWEQFGAPLPLKLERS
jgi:hypothetical protein